MKLSRILAVSSLVFCLTANTIFAQADINTTKTQNKQQQKLEKTEKGNKDFSGKIMRRGNCTGLQKDPLKALESKKERIQSLLKEGKISKEEADRINAKIDSKIKEVKEFNKLPLEKKREKLISDFKVRLERKVKDGKMTKEKMDELLKDYTEKINKWDGKGYPGIYHKGKKLRNKPRGSH